MRFALSRFAIDTMDIFKMAQGPPIDVHNEKLLTSLFVLAEVAVVHILLVLETSQQLSILPHRGYFLTCSFFGSDSQVHFATSMISISMEDELVKLELLLVIWIGTT
jgi:hypothetical protein